MRRLVAVASVVGMVLLGMAGAPVSATTPGVNGAIVFGADLGLGFELYAINPDGTGFHQLTDADGNAIHPDWGPGGRRIAFQLEAEDHSSIAIMNADGSHMHELRTTGFEGQPAFTPDGHHLVYECDCDPQGIFIMRDDGTHRRRLSTNPFRFEADSDPNVSPDGQTVTFVRHKVDEVLQALFAVDRDGANVRKIVPYTEEVAIKHDWAPDGRHIVITTAADSPMGRTPNVATVRPDGSDLTKLTHYSGGKQVALAGSYSPDGRWIAFRVENAEAEEFGLFKMHPNGSDRELIEMLPFAPRYIDWGSQP